MNQTTLAHIGGEVVVIGAVAFYFHRKTTQLEEEVAILRKENETLARVIEDMQENLAQLGQVVAGSSAGFSRPQRQMPIVPENMMMNMMQQPPPPKPSKKHHKKKRRVVTDSDSADDTFDDRELDQELAKEYEKLTNERKEKIECTDNVCKLVTDE